VEGASEERQPSYSPCEPGKAHHWDIDQRNFGRCRYCGAEWQFPTPAYCLFGPYESAHDVIWSPSLETLTCGIP